MRKLSRKSPV